MIRVLVIDDSALVRQALTSELSKAADIEVVGAAPDPYVARTMIAELKPDVLTLDIEMPRMDGLTFLSKLMEHHPLPVIVLSSLSARGSQTALEALSRGAVEVLHKPSAAYSLDKLGADLCERVRIASTARVSAIEAPKEGKALSMAETTNRVITIGASTGGTTVVEQLLKPLPPNCPPIVIVQHMPLGFTKPFAEQLDKASRVRVREAYDGATLAPGMAWVAPGDRHVEIRRSGARYLLKLNDSDPVSGFRPSVDVLFRSSAKYVGANGVGVLLTGMGRDGAEGMLEMRGAEAHTIAQDEATSVVFGMPKEAILLGAAKEVQPAEKIAEAMLSAAAEPNHCPSLQPTEAPT